MAPSPTPTALEIERVREITRLQSYPDAETLVNLLNDAQWGNTLEDVSEWESVRDKYTAIKGGLLGANKDPADRKLAITNRVRERLGLEPLNKRGMVSGSTAFASITVEPD